MKCLIKVYSASRSSSLRVSSSAWMSSFVDILSPFCKEYTTRPTFLWVVLLGLFSGAWHLINSSVTGKRGITSNSELLTLPMCKRRSWRVRSFWQLFDHYSPHCHMSHEARCVPLEPVQKTCLYEPACASAASADRKSTRLN